MAEHGRVADKSINDSGSVGKMREMCLRPGVRGMGLCVSKGAMLVLYNPLPHQWLIEIVCDEGLLFFRITPPAHDLRCPQPTRNHAQIGTSE